uniref:Uncharacterized protein n=1 Tax=Pyxicephalus adspersus TaxID=30357 RepID=A0AAV3ATF4_PYXAD|nr:TPA: hypothetical protein GDO54_007046 [Pyxicephalus adspersus]
MGGILCNYFTKAIIYRKAFHRIPIIFDVCGILGKIVIQFQKQVLNIFDLIYKSCTIAFTKEEYSGFEGGLKWKILITNNTIAFGKLESESRLTI